MANMRLVPLLVGIAGVFMLPGCFTVPTENVVESMKTLKTLSGSVQEYQKRIEDVTELGKLKGTLIKEEAVQAKERVNEIVEGVEKVQEGIEQIRGEGEEADEM